MAPDFEYFVRLAPDDGYGHTLAGTFLLTFPLALVTLWLWHAFVKGPVVELFPGVVKRRMEGSFGEFRFGGAARFGWIVLSILIGIATHLLWDSFTHPNTWIYRQWPTLRESHHLGALGAVPVYKIFQHGSTVVGAGVLVVWLGWWYWKSEELPEEPCLKSASRPWILGAAAISFVGAVIRATITTGVPSNHLAQKRFLGVWVVTVMALMWWQVVAYGFWRTRALAK